MMTTTIKVEHQTRSNSNISIQGKGPMVGASVLLSVPLWVLLPVVALVVLWPKPSSRRFASAAGEKIGKAVFGDKDEDDD
jgi:hypothetical protein